MLNRLRFGLTGFYDQFNGRPNFSVNIYVHKFGDADDRNPIFRKVPFCQNQSLDSLVYGAGANSLNLCPTVFTDYPSDSPRYGSSAGVCFNLDDIHLYSPFINTNSKSYKQGP